MKSPAERNFFRRKHPSNKQQSVVVQSVYCILNLEIGARLGYHPHIFSTMAESIAKTNENVAQKNANEEKNPVFFLYAC